MCIRGRNGSVGIDPRESHNSPLHSYTATLSRDSPDVSYDLHCHSTCSDGELTPLELCERALGNGVTHLSITDHDTLGVYVQHNFRAPAPLVLIPGIELSTQWAGRGIHIVGLNVDPENARLRRGVESQQATRHDRAEKIAARLARLGLGVSIGRVREIAGPAAVGRPHFARYLVETGVVADTRQAFRKYLGAGKPGDVRQEWASLQSVTEWITTAGGTAVIAHPGHYRMTRNKLVSLVDEFREAGGRAIEVISGAQDVALTARLARLADEKRLYASCGSDFHRPQASWSDVGRVSRLPDICQPVWLNW